MSHLFGSVEVFDVVDVNISKKNESFNVVWMVPHKLVEERGSFQRSMIVGEEESQIEEGGPKVFLQFNSLFGIKWFRKIF